MIRSGPAGKTCPSIHGAGVAGLVDMSGEWAQSAGAGGSNGGDTSWVGGVETITGAEAGDWCSEVGSGNNGTDKGDVLVRGERCTSRSSSFPLRLSNLAWRCLTAFLVRFQGGGDKTGEDTGSEDFESWCGQWARWQCTSRKGERSPPSECVTFSIIINVIIQMITLSSSQMITSMLSSSHILIISSSQLITSMLSSSQMITSMLSSRVIWTVSSSQTITSMLSSSQMLTISSI